MLLTPEQEQIRDMLRDFARKQLAPKAAEWDRTAHFPREELRALGRVTAELTTQFSARHAADDAQQRAHSRSHHDGHQTSRGVGRFEDLDQHQRQGCQRDRKAGQAQRLKLLLLPLR